jgi:hypothetical protein
VAKDLGGIAMLRAASGIIIVIAALCAVSAQAQSERSDDGRPTVSRRSPQPKAMEVPDAFCRSDYLSAIDRAICADRALVDKHIRVGAMQRSLETVVGFPRTLRFEEARRAWLGDRVQCTGPDVTECLHRLYDARIQELAYSIATEPLSKP